MNTDRLAQANEIHLQLSLVLQSLKGIKEAKNARDLWAVTMSTRLVFPDDVLAQMQAHALRWLESESSRLRDEFGAL